MISVKKTSDVSFLSLLPSDRIPTLKKEDLLPYVEEKGKEMLLVLKGDNPIGFLASSLSEEESEIDYLAITKEEEGKGYASSLLEEYLIRRKEEGQKTVFLEVRESNRNARKLYEKFGFEIYRRRKNYYLNPMEDAICYRKELVP